MGQPGRGKITASAAGRRGIPVSQKQPTPVVNADTPTLRLKAGWPCSGARALDWCALG